MKILLTGVTGQVGHALNALLAGKHEVTAPTRAELDLSDLKAVEGFLKGKHFDLILNPGAYTAVDKAESETALAHTLNAELPLILAARAHDLGARMVHYSTDYVFDGSKTTPWLETDAVRPLSVYGQSKLDGEQAVLAHLPSALVFRTSWVYSRIGKNMFNTVWRFSQERDELKFVNDQTGVPNWAPYLAALTLEAVDKNIAPGLYNLSASGETTWFGFVEAIVANLPAGMKRPRVLPIKSSEFPTPVTRPAYSVLDTSKLAQALGHPLSDWREGLMGCLKS